MPTATLTFNLPDERDEFSDAVYGANWHSGAPDLDQRLRQWLKYGHEFKDANEALQAARDALWEEVRDRGVLADEGLGQHLLQ